MKILYIEDNPTAVKNVQRLAALIGCECLVAVTGAQGLALLDDRPDIVLTDMELPDYDGIPLIREIRSRGSTVPIIAITGFALVGEREQCFEAGCNEYLRKPYELSALMDLLRRYGPATSS
ncbi:MAG: response regulator [Chloroflexota bacterium]